MEIIIFYLLELWRSADELKAKWNVLYTMRRGGRNQSPAHPQYAKLIFIVVFTREKNTTYANRFPLLSFSHLPTHTS